MFISNAYAQSGGTGEPNSLMTFLPLIVICVIMYFLMIKPQIKRQKEHTKMVSGLNKDDEIIMSSGLLGKIIEVQEQFLIVEISQNVKVQVQKQAVSQVLPKGTLAKI